MRLKSFVFVVYFAALLELTVPAHTQSLDGLSYSDRSSLEMACILAKSNGPATYHACLNQQLSLLGNDKAPNLDTLSYSDRSSLEMACILAKSNGPAAYHACLNQQLSLLGNDKAPNLDTLSYSDRSSLEMACILAKSNGPAAYHACLKQQLGSQSTSNSPVIDKSQLQPSIPNTIVPSHLTTTVSPLCAENGSCYGDISERTGLPKTVPVHGYYRANGTYVRGYYRSK
jgi:hypothetical protein